MKRYFLLALAVLILGGAYIYLFRSQNPTTPVDQSHRSYKLTEIQKADAGQIKLNLPTLLKFKVQNDKGKIIKDFNLSHQKLMHLIIIREDLTNFQHLHPDFDQKSGEFTTAITFTSDGPYRFYADFVPNDNPSKLPVVLSGDLKVGQMSQYQPYKVKALEGVSVSRGEYKISYILPAKIISRNQFNFIIEIYKNNQPVNNLQNYLGALGHSVIIKEGTLEYIHTHPEDADSEHALMGHAISSTGPEIKFSTKLPEPGVYKAFTQFMHQNQVITAEHVFQAQ